MKKILMLFIIVVSTCCFANAQTPTPTPYKVYCEIVGTGNFFGTKISRIDIDMGQPKSMIPGGTHTLLVDENNEKIKFNSMMDAINYLSKFGWEFVQAYVLSSVGQQYVYHYILSKNITNDEQIKEGIYLKE